MRIQYKANGQISEVRDSVGKALIARGLAKAAYQTRQVKPDEPEREISPRTGKPKRRYRRRDMTAED